MPYIEQEQRKKFDKTIELLALKLLSETNSLCGNLNYIISTLLYKIWEASPSYLLGASLVGSIDCVKTEFYRRVLAPYEDEKKKQNGDVYEA